MAELDDKVIVTKSKITDIADALREEMSESNEYSLPTMAEKVHELGQGQGSVYTAGVGIDITNRVVSVVDTLMIRGESSGSIASFDDGGANMPMKSCIVSIEPIQSGSGDPSPSNVRPITGWTEANLNVVGKNSFKTTGTTTTWGNVLFTVNNDGTCVVNGTADGWSAVYQNFGTAKLKANTEYKLSFEGRISQTLYCDLYDGSTKIATTEYNDTVSVTVTEDTTVTLSIVVYYNKTVNNQLIKPMIRLASESDTEYGPYNTNSQTYNIEFPSQAGTVYGGTLDVTNGVLTVTDGYIASYNSETLPSTWISSMDVYAEGTTPTTGAEVVYKLATPQTYNVTPTEIKTLLGINNIFADCGDVDVEYVRDATLIINKLLELVSGNNRTMMKSAVVEKTDEVKEQKKDSVEENLDA